MDSKCEDDYLEDNNDNDNNDENYIIKTKICRRLSRQLGLDEIQYDYTGEYEVPKEHGLLNSDIIIPSYYHLHTHPSKIFNLDYFTIIKDDIRNFRVLNEYQLKYIKELSHEDKNELFDIFNNCIKTFNNIVDKDD